MSVINSYTECRPTSRVDLIPEKLNILVGTESGLLKGIDGETSCWENLNSFEDVVKKNEIVSMVWVDAEKTKLCIGRRCKKLDFYDLNSQLWYDSWQMDNDDNALKRVVWNGDNVISGDVSGLVQVWNRKSEQLQIATGGNLCCLARHLDENSVIATGGKENDAKIWDITQPEKPIFSAKNVRNDWLDLRVPVWLTDMSFIPQSTQIVCCTAYHQIRMYDPKSSCRRPVLNTEYGEFPLMSLSVLPRGNQVIVGNTNGYMALVDLRKGAMIHSFKGSAGSIRHIQCHPNNSTVASCGLDRYLRVHDVPSHTQLFKVYLKSRLNCLLYRDEPFVKIKSENTSDIHKKDAGEDKPIEEDTDDDDIWGTLKLSRTNKKHKLKTSLKKKSFKKSKYKVQSIR